MSLKAFHVFFIAVSVLLSFGFGAWCWQSEYGQSHTGYAALGAVAMAIGVGLIVYEVMFLRKFKQ